MEQLCTEKKKIQTKPNNDKKPTIFHDFNLKNSLTLKKKYPFNTQ